MSPVSSSERLDLYKRTEIRHLLSWTVQGHEKIDPILGKNRDHFPEVSRIVGSSEKSILLLEEMASAGFYTKIKVATEAICPDCGDNEISVSQVCPLCESPDIEKADRIEHYACGHIDRDHNFYKQGQLICPKCGKELKLIGTDYQRIEDIFHCNKCKGDTSALKVVGKCTDNNHTFSYDEIDLKPIYGYKFNEDLREEVTAHCLLERPLAEFMESLGYKTESLATLRGGTGAEHTFNIVASGNGKTVVINLTSSIDEVDRESVLNFFAELFDVKVSQGILIAIPRLSKDARTLAKLYAINFIEGETIEEILSKLPEIVTKPVGVAEITPETRVLQQAIEKLESIGEKTEKEKEITPQPKPIPIDPFEKPAKREQMTEIPTDEVSPEENEKPLELEDRLEKLRRATLKNIVRLEEWTAEEYRRMAESTLDPQLQQLYATFSEQEKRHRELLSEVASIVSPDEEIEFAEIPEEIREISRQFKGEVGDIYGLMLLMETHERLEREGMKRYREMAKAAPDERVKKIFETLITEHESNHRMFRETLDTLNDMYREISSQRKIAGKR
jgi:rubrerythrin